MDEKLAPSATPQAIEQQDSSSMASPSRKRPREEDGHGGKKASNGGRGGRGRGNSRERGNRGGRNKKRDMGRVEWRCVILEDPRLSLD